mgnify:CR=1 FL=1
MPRCSKQRAGSPGWKLSRRVVETFSTVARLDRLEAFAAERGADFYGLPRNPGQIVLERTAWTVPAAYPFGDDELVPMRGGNQVGWRLVTQ